MKAETKISLRTVQLGLRKEESRNRQLMFGIKRLAEKPNPIEERTLLALISESNANIRKLCWVLTELAGMVTVRTKADLLTEKMQATAKRKSEADKKAQLLEKELSEVEKELGKEIGEEALTKLIFNN